MFIIPSCKNCMYCSKIIKKEYTDRDLYYCVLYDKYKYSEELCSNWCHGNKIIRFFLRLNL